MASLATTTKEQSQKAAAPEQLKLIKWLRNKAGMKKRVGAFDGRRYDYFKGSSAIKALLSPAYAKLSGAPKVSSEEEAKNLLHSMLSLAFYLKVERGGSLAPPSTGGAPPTTPVQSIRILQISPQQQFTPDCYYIWLYEGTQWTTILGGIGMVVIILAGVMFPLWPPSMKLGVWYLSVGVLGLMGLFVALAIFRLIFYVITIIVAKPGIWIFPNLFADVGVVDSFIPGWAWEEPPKKKSKKSTKDGLKVKKSKRGDRSDDGGSASGGGFADGSTKVPKIRELGPDET